MRIAVLHPGAMGAAIGAQLLHAGHDVVWVPAGRGEGTRRRASAAGLRPVDGVEGCDVVLSVVPPAAAEDVARAVAGFTGLYVDLNALAPDTAALVQRIVENRGGHPVDGGVIGPPPTASGTTRVFLSGDRAHDCAQLFDGTVVEPVVLEVGGTAASALKMAYGSWTKGSAALLLAARATAEHFGVGAALDEEWTRSQPELAQRLRTAESQATAKGWRWTDEMLQNARTFTAAGQPPGFGLAAAEIYRTRRRPDDR